MTYDVQRLSCNVSRVTNEQVAQYPPLRVGRDPVTWAFTLENVYVMNPSPPSFKHELVLQWLMCDA